jgi:hypothetical protein
MVSEKLEASLKDIETRCDAIEECYEYMLAYAAKGINGDEIAGSAGELRHYLIGAVTAMQGLAQSWTEAIEYADFQPAVRYKAFLGILERDAADSVVTLDLVLAQQWISSQLIDNVNASLHVRALLTDLFLIDELVKSHLRTAAKAAV